MAKIQYEVERVDGARDPDPGAKMKEIIEHGAKQGKELVSVIGFFNENLVVWKLPSRETRG